MRFSIWMAVAAVALGSQGLAGAAQSAAKSKPSGGDDFSGVWTHNMFAGVMMKRARPSDKEFTLMDGTVIPMRPEAEKIYRERIAMANTDKPFANTASRCLPIGTPQNMMGAPYPIQFVQRPDFIAILFEEGWVFRGIYINGKHPDEVVPSFLGHSIAHWEGKTLVIDTIGMRDDTTLDFTGMPHSTQMHITEHMKRTTPDTLLDEIEVDDPGMYTKPFTFKTVLNRTQEQMIEYICEDTRIRSTADGRQDFASPK